MNRKEQILGFLQDDPDQPFLLFALAKEYESEGSIENALHMYNKLYLLQPDYLGLYYHYAQLLKETQQIELAKKLFEEGILKSQAQKDTHSEAELKNALMQLNIEALEN
ncbi:MAG: tetratricopeptide repeat protein [Bacteroidota bacterium]|nr:tetratricopeptide repeat protein [Bacteroidota bacterium]